jgi:hypothetical protein
VKGWLEFEIRSALLGRWGLAVCVGGEGVWFCGFVVGVNGGK